jgi:acetate kinase
VTSAFDTTMGFTPTGGLVMSTRSGDLDAGVLLHLLGSKRTSVAFGNLLNQQAGLLGVSGISADMQDQLGRERIGPCAADAVELFCHQARKFVGALAGVLGGLDTLVFTAAIGEHAAPMASPNLRGPRLPRRRARPCPQRGPRADHLPEGWSAVVRVSQTHEDLMIARHTDCVISTRGGKHVPL